MLRTVGDQPTLWESLLPAEALVMPAELQRSIGCWTTGGSSRRTAVLPRHVGAAVDPDRDVPAVDVLEVPLPARVRVVVSRGGRLDQLAAVLSDPAGWVGAAPDDVDEDHHRCGQAAVDGLNEALLAKAVEAKVLKTNRVRADTTVVEANVAYPSDSGLLAKGVARMATTPSKLKALGLATRTTFSDRTRTVRSRARSINANLRRRNDDKLAEVRESTPSWPASPSGSPVRPTPWCATPAASCATWRAAADRAVPGRGRALERTAELTRRVAAQTRQRLAGDDPRRRDAGGVAARRRRPADRQGPARPTGRVRLQGPARRQRRRRHR